MFERVCSSVVLERVLERVCSSVVLERELERVRWSGCVRVRVFEFST